MQSTYSKLEARGARLVLSRLPSANRAVIILCSRCSEALPDEALELAGAILRGRCPGCDASLERALVAADGDAPEVSVRFRAPPPPPDTAAGDQAGPAAEACPKCEAPAPEGEGDCRRCGLARARFGSFDADSEAAVSEALRAAWQAVDGDWSDDGAHDRFVERAAAESQLAYAARCYRRAARSRGEGERVAAQLARIQRMAEVTFLTTPRRQQDGAEPEPYRRVVALLLALLLLAGAGGLYVLWRGAAQPAGPEPATRPAAPPEAPPPGTPFFRAPDAPAPAAP